MERTEKSPTIEDLDRVICEIMDSAPSESEGLKKLSYLLRLAFEQIWFKDQQLIIYEDLLKRLKDEPRINLLVRSAMNRANVYKENNK